MIADERVAARARRVRRRLARRVAATDRRDTGVADRVVGASDRRRHVAPRFDPPRTRRRRLRADGLPDHADRRLGRRLPQQHVPRDRAVRAQRVAVAAAGRTVGAQVARQRAPGPQRRRRRGDHRLLRRAPARRAAGRAAHRGRCSCGSRSSPSPIWRSIPACGATSSTWPPDGLRAVEFRPGRVGIDALVVRGDVGRRGMELVRRWPAVGTAARPARRQRSLDRVRLADRGDRRDRGERSRSRCGFGATRPTVTSASSCATCSPTARRR